MKRIFSLVLAVAMVLFLSSMTMDSASAQTAGKQAGKGLSMHGPLDDDGDGIINHDDPDYVRPKDGTGHQFGKAMKQGQAGQLSQFCQGKGKGHGQASGQGMRGRRIGPRDGSGLGTGSGSGTGTRTGVCDGTGPKGPGGR